MENEIEVLKEKSEDYQRRNEALQKNLEKVNEELGNLQMWSENLGEAMKVQQEEIEQLEKKNKELQDKVTKKMLELMERVALEQKTLQDCRKKFQAETEAKDVELENKRVENKLLEEERSAERLEYEDLREKVRRLMEMQGSKCFL